MHLNMRIRQRGAWLLAIGLVVLALALSACGGRVAPGPGTSGNGGSSNTTQQSGGGQSAGSNGGVTPLDGDLQDVQSLMQQLDSAASDANVDYSSLDNPTQP